MEYYIWQIMKMNHLVTRDIIRASFVVDYALSGSRITGLQTPGTLINQPDPDQGPVFFVLKMNGSRATMISVFIAARCYGDKTLWNILEQLIMILMAIGIVTAAFVLTLEGFTPIIGILISL